MKKIKLIFFSAFSSLLFLPAVALAQGNPNVEQGLRGVRGLFGFGGGISGSQTLGQFITNVIRMLLFFAAAIAVLFVIIGGYQYLTSAGDDEQAEKGKKTLINAIIGIVLIVLSYAIVTVISRTVTSSNSLFG